MESKDSKIPNDTIDALIHVAKLIENFLGKNIIYRNEKGIGRLKKRVEKLLDLENENKKLRLFNRIINDLKEYIEKEIKSDLFYLIGGHGGIIIDDIGFCEFDSPLYATEKLLDKMELTLENDIPYNLEIAICCLEWIKKNIPEKYSKFIDMYKEGNFEIINPTYSQPYNLIIGAESNIKQFEFGIDFLNKNDIHPKIYYCSETSLHPQIPQILTGFNIKYGSLKSRLLGSTPTANFPKIDWKGLDRSVIESIIGISGLFDGEYWHGTFYQELPNLLFQAASKPFLKEIIYSSIEDFIIDQPKMKEIWKISSYSKALGNFTLFSRFLENTKRDGVFMYKRDNFQLGDSIFNASNLYLQNRVSETSIITAEIIHSICQEKDYDELLDDLWKDLLLIQSHDCFAVPYIHHGDYCQFQLPPEELDKLILDNDKKVISELCIQINKRIQKKSWDHIERSILMKIKKKGVKLSDRLEKAHNIVIFNPSPYSRKDIVEIKISDNLKVDKYKIYSKNKKIPFQINDSKIKFVAIVPSFGYRVYKFQNRDIQEKNHSISYLYNLEISKDLKKILVFYKDERVFLLSFNLKEEYQLLLNEKKETNIQKEWVFTGQTNKTSFKIATIQYPGINRLELSLKSGNLSEILLNPDFKISKSYINYPFGIEETNRRKIQTLDFLWLKGKSKGILFMNKNSQSFIINHDNYLIRNLIPKKDLYEFAISITQEEEYKNPLYYVNHFNYHLFGYLTDYSIIQQKESYLSIDSEGFLQVTNLWRRKNKTYMRLFNPKNKEECIILRGKLVNKFVTEIDFKYNVISKTRSNNIKIKPWEIKTIQF